MWMMRTGITIFSLAFATAWFLWSQLHWYHLEARNIELERRVQFFVENCRQTNKDNKKIRKQNTFLKTQVVIWEKQKRVGRKKNLATLKKLIKQRNIKFGIGGTK